MLNIDLLISLVLILIMFGIGVSLTIGDVKEVFSKPKALLIALTSQMILLPLSAFAICYLFEMPLYIKMGLIILAASPGGTTSGFITFLFRGNTALSIILTTINSLLTLISIPLIVNLALHNFYGESSDFKLPIWSTIKEIFVLTAIPAFCGIAFKYFNNSIATVIAKYTKPISTILLGIVFTLKFIGNEHEGGIQLGEILEILPFALLLNVVCFSIGFFVSHFFKLGFKNQITVSVESAVHNTTIAFLVSGTLLHQPDYGKVSLVYAMFSFWTALIFCFILLKINGMKWNPFSKNQD
ncbi:MAG TPA: bile acid:sodium symporter [Taishania sp.]|nr:bile acid:sodium symporter [Taishania sp.]